MEYNSRRSGDGAGGEDIQSGQNFGTKVFLHHQLHQSWVGRGEAHQTGTDSRSTKFLRIEHVAAPRLELARRKADLKRTFAWNICKDPSALFHSYDGCDLQLLRNRTP